MFKTLLSPLKVFTSATAAGVSVRDLAMTIGTILAVLGALGLLTPEQVEEITKQLPGLLGAIGAIVTVVVSLYRILNKSHSNTAEAVAKTVDAELTPGAPVEVKTPGPGPNIIVPPVA